MKKTITFLLALVMMLNISLAQYGTAYAKTKDYIGSGCCTVQLKDKLYSKPGYQYGTVKLKIDHKLRVKVVMYDLNNRYICTFYTKNATLKLGDDHNGYKIYIYDDGSEYRPIKVGAKWKISKGSNIKSIY